MNRTPPQSPCGPGTKDALYPRLYVLQSLAEELDSTLQQVLKMADTVLGPLTSSPAGPESAALPRPSSLPNPSHAVLEGTHEHLVRALNTTDALYRVLCNLCL